MLFSKTTPGATTPAFAGHVDFAAGAFPTSVAVGDVNDDGLPDLVVANSGSSTVSVLQNATPPAFGLDPGSVDFADQAAGTASSPRSVVLTYAGEGAVHVSTASMRRGTLVARLEAVACCAPLAADVLSDEDAEATATLRRLYGDSNNDGTVDGTDFGFFGAVFGTTPGVGNSPFDFNNDGTIDGTDFGAFGNRFGLTL